MFIAKFILVCTPGRQETAPPSKQKTPRDQFLVARDANRFERCWNYFGCSFNAAELMQ